MFKTGKFMDMNAIVSGIIGVFAGGTGAVIAQRLLPSKDVKAVDDAKVRDELWKRVVWLEEQVSLQQTTIDSWQEKYFSLRSEHAVMKNQYEYMSRKYDEMKAQLRELTQGKGRA